jgi:hypothetical protein
MSRITREALLRRLQEGRKIEARLRGLARRLERVSSKEAQELMTLVQPEPLAESDRIREAIPSDK